MIEVFGAAEGRLASLGRDLGHFEEAIWIDLLRPDKDEETALERALGIDVPTRDEMQDLEISSRLYSDEGAHFMTALMLSHTDTDNVVLSPITFILSGERLITVRYEEPRAIATFAARACKGPAQTADALMLGLIEAIIERNGDVLERAGHQLDLLSSSVFAIEDAGSASARRRKPRDFQTVLDELGRKGSLLSKVRESLNSLLRLLAFDSLAALTRKPGKEIGSRIRILSRDVQSLMDHTQFLTQKVTFLLDATLGMINIQQTGIIKIFSVAAVVFLPPTLIASIYGMNFEVLPELSWPWGYPFALGLMLLSAIVPYQIFKWRGWL